MVAAAERARTCIDRPVPWPPPVPVPEPVPVSVPVPVPVPVVPALEVAPPPAWLAELGEGAGSEAPGLRGERSGGDVDRAASAAANEDGDSEREAAAERAVSGGGGRPTLSRYSISAEGSANAGTAERPRFPDDEDEDAGGEPSAVCGRLCCFWPEADEFECAAEDASAGPVGGGGGNTKAAPVDDAGRSGRASRAASAAASRWRRRRMRAALALALAAISLASRKPRRSSSVSVSSSSSSSTSTSFASSSLRMRGDMSGDDAPRSPSALWTRSLPSLGRADSPKPASNATDAVAGGGALLVAACGCDRSGARALADMAVDGRGVSVSVDGKPPVADGRDMVVMPSAELTRSPNAAADETDAGGGDENNG